MVDNVAVTAGAGTSVATDDIAGVHYQRVKVTWGPDGTANDADVATGKPMPIQLRSSTGTAVTVTDGAPAVTDFGLVVGIHPDSQNANGRAAAADGAPVTLSTEDLAEITSVKTAVQLIDDAIIADDAAFTPATTKVMMAGFQADEASTDSVTEGDGGAARMTLDRKIIVTQQPHTSGGLTPWVSLDLDETEEEIKTSAGQLYWYHAANRTTSPLYLRFYNALAANVTVGSTPTFLGPFEIPANASDHTVEIANFGGNGVPFDTAITAAVTTGSAADNAGAPAADACIVNVLYK
jgi:hypothetical protein